MSCLADFDLVKNNLRMLRKGNITALHKFVFHREGDRLNRSRLRVFEGFDFDETHEKYEAICSYVIREMHKEDLVSICITLGLKYDAPDLVNYIFKNLRKGSLLDTYDDEGGEDANEDTDGEDANEDTDDEDANEVTSAKDANDEHAHNEKTKDVDEARRENEEFQNCVRDIDSMSVVEQRVRPTQTPRFVLSFRDVEDSIKPFDGSNSISIEAWVNDFEETAAVLYWDELQTFIFAKKSLQGLAKLFIAGCKGITTWPKLKNALLDEFKMKVNSRQIHRMLTERNMNKSETVTEYLYKMKEIASRGDVVDADLIHYVIDGIKDTNPNKQMLYGAHNLREFKEKLRDYEVYAAKQNASNDRRNTSNEGQNFEQKPLIKKTNIRDQTNQNRGNNDYNRCYNCGESGHLSSNCKNKSRGAKCFRCNKFGPMARDCNDENNSNQNEEVRCINAVKDSMLKRIKITEKEVNALIDTGSMVNLMKKKTYDSLKLKELTESNVTLTGFGQADRIRPIGVTSADVLIDDEIYKIQFCVVPDKLMSMEVVIGAPICQEAEIIVNAEEVRIRKTETMKIMNIDVQRDGDTRYNIEETISSEARDKVKQLIEKYEPKEEKSANVSMKIELTNDTVANMITEYLSEIGKLRAKLIESEEMYQQLKKHANSKDTPRSNKSGGVYEDPENVLTLAKREVEKEREALMKHSLNGLKDDVNNCNVDEESDSDDSDSDSDEKKIEDDLDEINSDIEIKTKLIEQLEYSQERLQRMSCHYEEKSDMLNKQISNTQKDRDEFLANMSGNHSTNPSDKVKKVKEEYARKLNEMQVDIIAIKRTQFKPGLKLKAKYLGPYKISAVKPDDTYDVLKFGDGEGPKATTTCAEDIKMWPSDDPFEAQG